MSSLTKLSSGEFTPAITEAMRPAYELCQQEKGKRAPGQEHYKVPYLIDRTGRGMFARMKDHMARHVSNEQDVMFKTASDQVRASLEKLCKLIKNDMLDKADQVFVAMSRDYTQNNTVIKLTREERAGRRAIDELVGSAHQEFRDVLDEVPHPNKFQIPAALESSLLKT